MKAPLDKPSESTGILDDRRTFPDLVRIQVIHRLGYRQAGKASDFDSDIPRFESWYPIQFSCVKFRSKKSFYGSAATGSSHGYVGLGPVDYFFGGDFFAFLIKSLESQNSTSGYIEFEELAFNGTANIKVWSQVGVEAGSTFFSLVTSPEKDMENPIGVGLLYGLTYLLNEELQLRIRREDKLLKNSYDIQPGYSFSISYLFD